MSEIGDKLAQWCIDNQNNGWYYTNDGDRGGPYYREGCWGADCSSYVNIGLVQIGVETPKYLPDHAAWSTSDMPAALTELGFKDYEFDDNFQYSDFEVGDILHIYGSERGTTYGHTEIITSLESNGCYTCGMHKKGSDHNGIPYYNSYNSLIRKGSSGQFKRVFKAEGISGTGKNCSLIAAAGACGNMVMESWVNPVVWEGFTTSATWTTVVVVGSGTLGGYGLIQWTNTANTEADYRAGNISWRLRDYHNWTQDNNYTTSDGNAQVQYILEENHWGTAALSSHGLSQYESITTVTEFFEYDWPEDALDDATAVFGYCCESGNLPASWVETRQGYAKTVYDYLVDHWNDDSINTWVNSKNSALSQSEWLNNSVLVFKKLNALVSGGASTGGTVSTPTGNGTNSGDEAPSFDDFLMSMLGKNGQQSTAPVHIKGDLL